MKLNSITLINFRQFYGQQKIEFANGDKNVTIIFGENGKGKTGIFRALMFGLFGSRYLNQDNKNDEIHLVNFIRIDEEKGSPITATVKIDFCHMNKRYIVQREVIGYKIGDKIEERICPPKLYEIDEYGNFLPNPIEDELAIKSIINNILDEKIKDFFLFDTERIDTLAKTNAHVKSEVKAIIIKLLQIDKLNKAILLLKGLYSKENNNIIKKSSNLDLKAAEIKVNDLKKEIADLQEKIDIKNLNIECCNNEIEDINEKLAENEEIKKLQNEVSNIKEKRNDKNRSLKYLKESLKENNFNKCHMFLMKDYYLFTNEYLNQISVKQKDLIPYEVIEKSLKDMVCNCCKTNLNEVKSAYEEILNLKENYRRSEITPLITEINGTIIEFNKIKDQQLKNMYNKLREIREIKDDIDELDSKIEIYKEEMQEFSKKEENLKKLENSLGKKLNDKEKLTDEVKEIMVKVGLLEKNLSEAVRNSEELMSKDKSLKKDKKKLEYISELKLAIERIFNDYSDEMRNKLMEETTRIFKILIDKKDKAIIEKIKINEKYEIELYNWLGTKMTQDISQGQRQIVSLSFITALAKIAGGDSKNIDFPLFMDTPFGRISGNNRDNLIENIPGLTSQWILLLTDTEFSVSEEIKMKEVDKLGKWYKLDQIKEGHTNIVSIGLNENMATRR